MRLKWDFDGLWWALMGCIVSGERNTAVRQFSASRWIFLKICSSHFFLKRNFSFYFLFGFFVSRWIFPGIFSFYSWFTFFLSRQGGIRFNTVNMTPPILGIISGTSLTSIIDWYSPKGVYRQIPSPGTVLVNIAPKAGWIENSHRGKLPHSKSVWNFSYNLCRKIIAIS